VKKSPIQNTDAARKAPTWAAMSTSAALGRGKGYFQFPLCLLAFGEDYKERLQTIASYCLYREAGRKNPRFPKSAGVASLDQAATFFGLTIAWHDIIASKWEEANGFVCQWQGRHGKDALVRIGVTLWSEAHDNTGLTYREFSLLCAINSIIGNRSGPTRITEPRIRVRAAGFKCWNVAKSELPSEELRESRLLTPHQVRYMLEGLHERRFFARARVGAKTVKYMLRVTDDELRTKLLQTESRHARFRTERGTKDAEFAAAIRNIRNRPINVGKNGCIVMCESIQSRGGNGIIPDVGPDINISTPNNGSFNNCIKNKAPLSFESGSVFLEKKQKEKKLDRSEFSEEELAFIDLYHRICVRAGLGFLPVTQRSKELDIVLERFATDFDAGEWRQKFREAVECRREVFRTNPCKGNTLVQVCWDHYAY
jgi:hypothetical protein